MAEVHYVDDSFDPSILAGASCAFGVFDGVHRGHRFLLDQAKRTARADGARSVVLTFDIDPDELFHPHRLKKLATNEQRLELIAAQGVDAICVIPFTRAFAASEPEDFLQALFGKGTPAHLHIGHDFRFGSRACGTVDDLRAWAAARGIAVHAHHLCAEGGEPITATRIRLLLGQGKVAEAAELLGYPYTLRAKVVRGRGDGAAFGFATANARRGELFETLADGVYGGAALVDGRWYRAAIAVGLPPMFEGATADLEVHLLDFAGDLYERTIDVRFIAWRRPMESFDSVDALIATVQADIAFIRESIELPEGE